MPNQPKTPKRGVRIDEPLWLDAQRIALINGESVSDVIRRALTAYVSEHKPSNTKREESKA